MHTRWTGFFGACALGAAVATTGAPAQAQDGSQEASQWVKLCQNVKLAEDQKKDICLTKHERFDPLGRFQVGAAIRDIEGMDKQWFVVTIPAAVTIPAGLMVQIDDDDKVLKMNFSACVAGTCSAEAEAPGDLVDKLRKGNEFTVVHYDPSGRRRQIPAISLQGFTKPLAGEPTDPKLYEQSLQQMMVQVRKNRAEFQRRAVEAQKKAAEQPAAQE